MTLHRQQVVSDGPSGSGDFRDFDVGLRKALLLLVLQALLLGISQESNRKPKSHLSSGQKPLKPATQRQPELVIWKPSRLCGQDTRTKSPWPAVHVGVCVGFHQ